MNGLHSIAKFGYRSSISRELAIDAGLITPTPEEAANRSALRAEFDHRQEVFLSKLAVARHRLDALTDPTARAVLDLHHVLEESSIPECDHCYSDTEMGDHAAWPCETVATVAKANDIEVPTW